MKLILLILFFGIPALEIGVFLLAGEKIGFGTTIATTILTSAIGIYLLKNRGLQSLFRLQEQIHQGHVPLRESFSSFCLLISGALLLTPGFITDSLGFLLLFPPIQTILLVIAIQSHKSRRKSGARGTRQNKFFRKQFNANMHKFYRNSERSDGLVIDGECQNLGENGAPNSEETEREAVVHRIE